jgi:hypothetical protein
MKVWTVSETASVNVAEVTLRSVVPAFRVAEVSVTFVATRQTYGPGGGATPLVVKLHVSFD